jgi:hypothetical protein
MCPKGRDTVNLSRCFPLGSGCGGNFLFGSFRIAFPAVTGENLGMCNRFVQNGREVKPGERATVLMVGPAGKYELPFDAAVFGGPARNESRNYWIKREGAESVIVPGISSFGEKSKVDGSQNWEGTPPESSLDGLLLPTPPGRHYRLLKIVTQPATPEQLARLGNDRAPVVVRE